MKTSCIVTLFLLATVQVSWSHSVSEEVKECAEEHNVKAEDMKKFWDEKTATHDVKCFMKCVLMRIEVLKDDGSFDLEIVKKHDESLVPIVEACSTHLDKTDDLCELAFQHHVCMTEKSPEGKWKEEVLEHIE